MLPNPEMTLQLVRDHQRDLLREAELDRLAAQADTGQPTSASGARRPFSALGAALSRVARLRPTAHTRRPSVPRVLASTEH